MSKRSKDRKAEEYLAKVLAAPLKRPVPEPAPLPRPEPRPQVPPPQAAPKPVREPKPKASPPRPPADPETRRLRARLKRKGYEARRLKPHREAVKQELRKRWPRAFPSDESQVRPWAKGIFHEICQASIGFNKSTIRVTLKDLANTIAYQGALAAGGPRYDLNGDPRGDVSPKESEFAKTWLAQLRSKLSQAPSQEQAAPATA